MSEMSLLLKNFEVLIVMCACISSQNQALFTRIPNAPKC